MQAKQGCPTVFHKEPLRVAPHTRHLSHLNPIAFNYRLFSHGLATHLLYFLMSATDIETKPAEDLSKTAPEVAEEEVDKEIKDEKVEEDDDNEKKRAAEEPSDQKSKKRHRKRRQDALPEEAPESDDNEEVDDDKADDKDDDDEEEGDLVEIDESNIISGGRRTRGKRVDYAKAAEDISEDEDEDEEEDVEFEGKEEPDAEDEDAKAED